jgi:hypothetical protein
MTRHRVGAVLGFRATIRRLTVIAIGVGMMLAPAAGAQLKTAKIAVALSLTGPNASLGKPELEGVRLAVEEANKSGSAPTIEISVHDDASNAERGRKIAREIGDSDALVVLGPSSTAMGLECRKDLFRRRRRRDRPLQGSAAGRDLKLKLVLGRGAAKLAA